VTQFRDEGYLPEAMINYLARLGWSHGDDEVFSSQQFLAWFDLDHLGRSAAQFDEAKLRWVNAQHMKTTDDEVLAALVLPQLHARGLNPSSEEIGRLPAMCGLLKDRCDTTVALTDWVVSFFNPVTPAAADLEKYVTPEVTPAIHAMADALAAVDWTREQISACMKTVLSTHGLKMPQLAMPIRVLVMGTPNTPSVDAMLALHEKKNVIERLRSF
jgi:glutamyl-tRNA synthetase